MTADAADSSHHDCAYNGHQAFGCKEGIGKKVENIPVSMQAASVVSGPPVSLQESVLSFFFRYRYTFPQDFPAYPGLRGGTGEVLSRFRRFISNDV
jgi:hypothetical protein